MALAARALDGWAGGTGRVREPRLQVLPKPVVVPDDDDGVTVTVDGTVKAVTDEGVQVALEVTCGGEKVSASPGRCCG